MTKKRVSTSRRNEIPRTVFVRFPYDTSLGETGNVGQPRTVLADLFRAVQDITEAGTIVEPGYRWRRTEYPSVEAASFLRKTPAHRRTA